MHGPEFYEKKEIKAYLDSIGAWHFSPYMAGFGGSGVPDIIFCWDGHFGAVEVKREGKMPTKLQEKRIQQIKAAGGAAFWGTAKKVIVEIREWILKGRLSGFDA